MEKFKAGDLVYDLRMDGNIYEIVDNPHSHTSYKIAAAGNDGNYHIYTETGLFFVDDELPTLIKATEENYKALTSIFGDVFQNPADYTKTLSSEAIIQALIAKQGFAWCGVSDNSNEEAREQGKSWLCKIVKVVEREKYDSEFHLDGGTVYLYAVPFDPNTGDEITDLAGKD